MADMLSFFQQATKPLTGYWHSQTASRKRLLVTLAVLLIGIAVFLSWFINRSHYEVLYTGLSTSEAGAILQQLSERKVDARPQGADTILVPREQVDALRMDLAASGYPKSGDSLEILQQGTGFGMTEEDKEIYRRYQLQQDLQNAIRTFDAVADARVSLNMPEKSNFVIENQQVQATAAVLLTLKSDSQLSAANVEAIAQLVEKSVPDLQPDGITIIDSNMNVLNTQQSTQALSTDDQFNLETQIRERLKGQVIALLQPVFGIDKVLAEVSVRLDFSDQVVESIRFEPLEGTETGIVSTIEKIRDVANANSGATGEGGTGTNGADIPTYPVAAADDSVYEKNSEKISYEINTIKESLTKAKGTIQDLSVSVILDGSAVTTSGYADSVKALVSNAIGVPVEYITVEALPFNGQADMDKTLDAYQAISEKGQQQEMVRFLVVAGIATALGLFVIIALLILVKQGRSIQDDVDGKSRSKRKQGKDQGKRPGKDKDEQDEIYNMFPSLNPAGRTVSSNFSIHLQPEPHLEANDDKTVVEKYVRENPELAANIIRGWLAEEQA